MSFLYRYNICYVESQKNIKNAFEKSAAKIWGVWFILPRWGKMGHRQHKNFVKNTVNLVFNIRWISSGKVLEWCLTLRVKLFHYCIIALFSRSKEYKVKGSILPQSPLSRMLRKLIFIKFAHSCWMFYIQKFSQKIC